MATLPATVDLSAIEKLTPAEAKKLEAAEILKLVFPEDRPLYTPHGKWEWITGEEFVGNVPGTPLGCMLSATRRSPHATHDLSCSRTVLSFAAGLEGQVDIKVSYANNKRLVHISKLCACLPSITL